MSTHTPMSRERISRGLRYYHASRKRSAQLGPRELHVLMHTGAVAPALVPYVAQAMHEVEALTSALGGEEHVSEQRMLLIRDVARLGTLLAALVAHALQREVLDLDEVAKITSLASARGRLLQAIGVDRIAAPVPSLREYLDQREREQQAGAGEAIDVEAEPAVEDAGDRGAGAEQRDVAPSGGEG